MPPLLTEKQKQAMLRHGLGAAPGVTEPLTAQELEAQGYYVATVEEAPHSLQLATRKGLITYAPPEVKYEVSDKKVLAYVETPGGKRTLYAAPIETKPPSIAERILEFMKGPATPHMEPTGLFTKPKFVFEPVKPFAAVGGFVAYPESLAYAGMTWLGFEPPTRPPPAPSVEPEYALGYEASMVAASLLVGEATEKLWAKLVQKPASTWLTKQYLEAGPAEWKGLPERIVMKLTGAKPYIAGGEVALPPYAGAYSFEDLPYGYGFRRVSTVDIAWEMTQAPRTSGIWIRQAGLETVAPYARVLRTLFTAGEFAIELPGVGEEARWVKPTPEEMSKPLAYQKYAWRIETFTKTYFERAIPFEVERGLLPYVTQTEVTRLGIIPYAPTTPTLGDLAGKSMISWLLGFGIVEATIPKPKPSVTPKPVEMVMPKLFEVVRPKIAEFPSITQIPAITQFPEVSIAVSPVQKQILSQEQVQRQVQSSLQMRPSPAPYRMRMAVPPFFEAPSYARRKRRKGEPDLFGLYGRYKRKYPLASAKEVLKMAIG